MAIADGIYVPCIHGRDIILKMQKHSPSMIMASSIAESIRSMPRESRTIVFNGREVHRAMEAFAARQQMPMPKGALDGLKFEIDAEPALTLTIKPMGTPVVQRVAFRQVEVAAALILLCRDLGIPLPKECRKNLVVRDGHPAFSIELD